MRTFRWKYVVIVDPVFGMELPIIFPECLEHKHVAQLGLQGKVLSAGFCQVDRSTDQASAWGESMGLNVKARPDEDAKLLRAWFVGIPTLPAAAAIESPKDGAKT